MEGPGVKKKKAGIGLNDSALTKEKQIWLIKIQLNS